MLKRQSLGFVVLAILAGCATQPPASSRGDSAQDLQCHDQRTTGSMMTRTVCTTKAERDAQQAATDQLRSSMEMQGGCRGSAAQCVGP